MWKILPVPIFPVAALHVPFYGATFYTIVTLPEITQASKSFYFKTCLIHCNYRASSWFEI